MGDPSREMGDFIDVRKAINPKPQLQQITYYDRDDPHMDQRSRSKQMDRKA
jgi:hypothetical protein